MEMDAGLSSRRSWVQFPPTVCGAILLRASTVLGWERRCRAGPAGRGVRLLPALFEVRVLGPTFAGRWFPVGPEAQLRRSSRPLTDRLRVQIPPGPLENCLGVGIAQWESTWLKTAPASVRIRVPTVAVTAVTAPAESSMGRWQSGPTQWLAESPIVGSNPTRLFAVAGSMSSSLNQGHVVSTALRLNHRSNERACP